METASGATNVNAWEYCDDDDSLTIAGVVQSITFSTPGDASSNIMAFDVAVTVSNSLPADFQANNASNSHNEVQIPQTMPGGEEFMTQTRITAEFALADISMLPSGTPPYWPDPVPSGSGIQYYIEAVNEDLWAWYCWDPGQTTAQYQPAGKFQVPAWNLNPPDIPPGGVSQVTMQFTVTGTGMPITDYRHSVIRASQQLGLDVLYNRHTSLKISHWLDTLLIDAGNYMSTPQPPFWLEDPIEVINASDASVFYNIEEETEYDHKMHWPQLPDPNGWDVRACMSPATDPEPDGLRKVLADDFLCTSNGYINQIIFWGSWFSNMFVEATQHPYQGITNIHLSIHRDIPDPDEEGPLFSMPDVLPLWVTNINPIALLPGWELPEPVEEQPSSQGWYDPNHDFSELNNHDRYFRYEILIPTNNAFYQEEGNTYWLDISVETMYGMWGWKTTTDHWNDDAVWADLPVTDLNQWKELRDPIEPIISLDLAFIINEKKPEVDWGDAPDSLQTPKYPTLAANSGANHTIVAGMFLGAGVDSEPDGQPNAAATGDDANINGLGGIAFPPGDEDGVVFTQLVPGLQATITVTASLAGNLDAWIDYNADGIWSASEKLTGATIALNPGANNINITVPTGTAPVLTTYARFRYSTAGGLSPAGPAADGEVEDYKVSIDDPTDWGDAPDPAYPTLSGSMGANHLIGGPFLGLSVDPELDGQPTALADGDDLDLQGDDEDGVTLLTQIIPGAVARINVGLGGAAGAPLDAWIDYNVDGIWGPGEKIFNSVVLGAGGNVLFFPVPGGATPSTNTFARFRVSSAGGLTPAGQAQDGEVEDYMFHIGDAQPLDWGDAPVSYQTLAINNGAHHVAVGGFLGTTRDAEADGQPNATATGDDIVGLPDEDGVAFVSKIQAGGYARINVVATAPGMLDAWIDFQKDGTWVQAVDRIFTSQPLTAGMNKLAFPVPLVATNIASQSTFARFRFSSGGVPAPTGLALNGEVEDYEVDIFETEYLGVDRGDAPDPTYPTLTNSVGASHTIIPGYVLGASIDSESEGQQSSNAQGDDIANIDDEDGVIFAGTIVAGSNVTINVVAGVSTPAYLDGWIDFDKNGSWLDSGEQVFASQSVSPGLNSLPITIPQPTALGPTFARFRLSSTGGLSPTGAAGDGEVEDYMVDLYQPQTSTNIVITNLFFKVSNTVAQVEWNAESNITYQVQSSTNLMTNVWTDVGGWLLGPVNWQTNSTSPDEQFYRVTAPWTE